MKILVTGATGYIGGRLIPRLLDSGHDVAVLVRDARRFMGRPFADRVTVIEGDLLQPDTLRDKLRGFDAAYYLVHSMLAAADFERKDRAAAEHFTEAVGDGPHVIYLGGIMPESDNVSRHLRSRAETGRVLRDHLPDRVTEFRAGPIIGSGSASFEMVRYLTERLPVMVTPRWVRNAVQPIGMRDVLRYLEAALDVGPVGIVPIGGDRLTFRAMMQDYAAERGLSRRWILATPVLAPGVAARWVGFFTPIPNRMAVPLVQGLIEPLIADTGKARDYFPDIEPLGYREAVRRALQRVDSEMVETRWSGSLGPDTPTVLSDEEGLIREVRRIHVDAPPEVVFDTFSAVGGRTGWLVCNWLWTIRGWLDKLVGGPGLRRGRRHPTELHEGEAVDFWRVERIDRPTRLRLRAEMKVPGRAWLQWEVEPRDAGGSMLTQTALFEPLGPFGVIYWYLLYPLHGVIFGGMARELARRAEQAAPDANLTGA